MSVFVDTSAIIAVFDTRDEMHENASRTWASLLQSHEELVTSNYVIVETISLLHSRFGVTAVARFVRDGATAIKTAWADESIHNAAVSAVLVAGRSGPSLVDCVSFEFIRRMGINRVFAYDRHFTEMGYEFANEEFRH